MTLTFPASFMLVAAMNPCPCGFFGDPTRECRCTGGIIQRYLGKISGPLLDRIDLHIEVPAVPYQELRGKDDGASSGRNARARGARPARFSRRAGSTTRRSRCASSGNCARSTMPAKGRSKWRCAEWDYRLARTTGS